MGERPSTARSRDLGKELVRVRKAKGLNGNDIAKKLGWERGKVTRAELGKQAIEELDLVAWLMACEVQRPELHRLVEINRQATQEIWVQHTSPNCSRYSIRDEEVYATTIVTYSLAVIPGLLQVPDYIRAMARTSSTAPEHAELLVDTRLARQKLLRGANAPEATFFLEEQVLRRPVGGPAVMIDQLAHLLFMCDWKKITIRVVPNDVGAHGALMNSFVFIERRDDRKVVSVDTRSAIALLETAHDIANYESTIEELDGFALSQEESKAVIAEIADEYGKRTTAA